MLLGFLDFEATGIDPIKAAIIEYAIMLFDTQINQPVLIKNELVDSDIVSDEVTEITGITNDMMVKWGHSPKQAMGDIAELIHKCDYVVAHNGLSYDKPLLEIHCFEYKIALSQRQWIDTRYDLPFPDKIKDRKLVHLAAAHGFVNPMAHRALSDVMTLQHLFCMYPLEKIIEIASTPLITIKAEVSFGNKDEAKKRGYYWDPDKKIWFKQIRECFYAKEAKAPFKVIVMK
jgi:DNA polymerase-3 subunit epsilon